MIETRVEKGQSSDKYMGVLPDCENIIIGGVKLGKA